MVRVIKVLIVEQTRVVGYKFSEIPFLPIAKIFDSNINIINKPNRVTSRCLVSRVITFASLIC